MANIGYATLTITPSIRGLQRGLERQLSGVMPVAGRRAGEQLGQGVHSGARRGLAAVSGAAASAAASVRTTFQRASSDAGASVGGIGDSFRSMAAVAGAALAAVGVANFGREILDVASGAQRTEAVLDGLYQTAGHGADEARKMTRLLNREFGNSEIAMQAFQRGAQDLAWLGLNARETTDLMQFLEAAIVATGGGEDEIGRVTGALATMQNQGKATLNEINMLSQSGIPIFDLMTDHLGITNEEFAKLVSEGEILLDDVLAAIEAQGGTWAEGLIDGAENVESTWSGAWRSIRNTVINGLAQQVVPLLDEMAPHVVELGEDIEGAFDRLPGTIDAVGERLDDAGLLDSMRDLRDIAVDIAEGAWPALEGAGEGVITTAGELSDALEPVRDLLGDFGDWLGDNEDTVEDFGTNVGVLTVGFLALRGAIWASTFALRRSPWGWAIVGVSALGAALDNASDDHDAFSTAVDDTWAFIGGSVSFWTSVMTLDWEGALQELTRLWSWWESGIEVLHEDFWRRFTGLTGVSLEDVLDWFRRFGEEGKKLWDEGPFVYAYNLIKRIYRAVVGNSIVPDMVTDILAEFLRLNTDGNSRWDQIGSGIITRAQDLAARAGSAIAGFAAGAVASFAGAREGIDSEWSGLRDVAAGPVRFTVNTVYDSWIRGVWSKVTDAFGGPSLPSFRVRFAQGGVFPGFTPGRDVHAMPMAAFSGGESVMRPEVTAAWGPQTTHALNSAAINGGVSGVRKALGLEPVQQFALGGIVSAMPGSVGQAARWLWQAAAGGDWTSTWGDGVLDFLTDPGGMVRRILGQVIDWTGLPHAGTGWAERIKDIPPAIIDKLVKQAESLLSFGGDWDIGGNVGARFGAALAFAKAQHGKPYIWGGVGPAGYDCSGFTSAITNVILGRNPYSRLHTTHGFTGPVGPGGFIRNARSPWMVGVQHSGVGHMAGTLLGVPVESSGSAGVRVGGGARGANTFPSQYGFVGGGAGMRRAPGRRGGEGILMDDGGLIQPGLSLIENRTGRPERVRNAEQEAQIQQLIDLLERGGTRPVIHVQPPPATVGELVDGVTYALRRTRRGGRYAGVA